MNRSKYGYAPRRSRPSRRRRWGWWLPLPIALVIGALLLISRLPDDDGGRLTASTGCPAGEDCAAAVLASTECPAGGACAASENEPAYVGSVMPGDITGRAAVMIEEPCGALLYDYNAHQRRAPASLTKIATALVALERADLSEMVDVRVHGGELAVTTDSTVMGLEPGQQLSVRDLLHGLLLPSGNDAAIAIAEHVGDSVPAFVGLMNSKVEQLGLGDTHFTNPHGLDGPDMYTSAFDIAMLGRELMREPELAAIVRTRIYQPAWDGAPLWNGNRLLYLYPESLGVKIGSTDRAGGTIVAAAERDGRRLFVSVLGSSDIYQDAITLFEWAFSNAPSVCDQ
ncbi:MAG: D-alanyl-D-alanine carboxypeptidase [Dehalococcoidia bacterium]|nr:MAG: D-alanyl-D-alanine carboxypeptidase [Dehalococcoidia bacterium]